MILKSSSKLKLRKRRIKNSSLPYLELGTTPDYLISSSFYSSTLGLLLAQHTYKKMIDYGSEREKKKGKIKKLDWSFSLELLLDLGSRRLMKRREGEVWAGENIAEREGE